MLTFSFHSPDVGCYRAGSRKALALRSQEQLTHDARLSLQTTLAMRGRCEHQRASCPVLKFSSPAPAYRGFCFEAMSVRQSSLVWQFSQSRHGARLVALAIADFCDDAGRAYPALETLAAKAAISERAAHAAIRQLKDLGELRVESNGGPHGVNVYFLTITAAEKPIVPDRISLQNHPRNFCGVQNLRGAENDTIGVQILQGGVQKTTKRGAESAPKPSGTVREPSTEPPYAALPRAEAGVKEGKNSSRIPTTPQSKRFAAIFHRRESTPWQKNEVISYQQLGTVPEDDLVAVEGYYAKNWPPTRGVNYLRTDLLTFLNNFQGEVGRAHAAMPPAKATQTAGPDPEGWREWLTAKGKGYTTYASAMAHWREAFAKR